MGTKTPRFDPYEKLLHRFYEPILLLKILLGNNTLGPHSVTNYEPNNPDAARRRFLKNLAYICDSEKGGSSVASIGVEERTDCFVLWLAFNEDDKGAGAKFLREILGLLTHTLSLPNYQRVGKKAELLERCVAHSSRKVMKEARCLSSSVRKSMVYIEREPGREDLLRWIDQFASSNSTTPLSMCELAFSNRHDENMRRLEVVLQELSDNGSSAAEMIKQLSRVRHYIGRLAHHIRSAHELLDDGSRLMDFLGGCEVKSIPLPTCVSVPPPDNHTNLQSIIGRMISPREEERREKITKSMASLSRLVLDADIVEKYGNDSFRPRVHAEVQVLEYFTKKGLRFAYSDRFIATSKMSCLCCKLYFRYHPARCEEPEAHGKLYANWGPIYLSGGSDHPDFRVQRDLMNKIIGDVRGEALDRLLGLTRSWSFHHDSLSGITPLGVSNSSIQGTASASASHHLSMNEPSSIIAHHTQRQAGGESSSNFSDEESEEFEEFQGGARL